MNRRRGRSGCCIPASRSCAGAWNRTGNAVGRRRSWSAKAPGYVLTLSDDAVDTWQFAALVRQAGISQDQAETVALVDEAMSLWTDTPFAAYQGHDWADAEITRLSDLRATAVELRATAALGLGRSTTVISDLEQHVRDYPLREQAVRLLALALYREGRQGEALAALSRARQQLIDDLGIDPGPELRQLESDILTQAAHLTAPIPVPVATLPQQQARAEPPSDDFVGRDAELSRLHQAAARTSTRSSVVWIDADAGFGKSTLVERFCDATIARQGSGPVGAAGAVRWTVARGRCSEVDGAPPGWAWHEVLRDLTGSTLGGGPPTVDEVFPTADRGAFVLARAIEDAVLALGPDRRALIVLDDLHRGDEETLQVLRHIANVSRSGVLLVGTFRSHEIGPPLATTLAAVVERTVDRIELGGLDRASSAILLRRFTDRPMTDQTRGLLVERSAGNPLFLRELGQLVAAEGVEDATSELPAAIRDLLLRRIGRLPTGTVDTLSRAAVLGRDIDFDVLLALESGSSQPHVGGRPDRCPGHGIGGRVAASADPRRIAFHARADQGHLLRTAGTVAPVAAASGRLGCHRAAVPGHGRPTRLPQRGRAGSTNRDPGGRAPDDRVRPRLPLRSNGRGDASCRECAACP